MENETYKKIIGFEKLTELFGYWPSFHDAEIISISLDRNGEEEWEGPILHAKIHVFQMGPETKNTGGNFIFHHHSIVTFRFANVEDLEIKEFNQQNAINGLTLSEKYNERLKQNIFEVEFEQSFGVSCTFICRNIEIINIEKRIPNYSVYKNT